VLARLALARSGELEPAAEPEEAPAEVVLVE
jgi:hypothetical protein